MNDNLYERIVNADEKESLRDIFASLNLFDGYAIIDRLEHSDGVKDKIIKYICFCYSYQSPLLKSKDEIANKKKILDKVGLEGTNDFINLIINNQDENINMFIGWWLDINDDPDWDLYISIRDFIADQLLFIREGLFLVFTGDDPKKAQWFMKNLKKDIELKGKAMQNVYKASEMLKDLKKKLDVKYEFLESKVKKDVSEFFGGSTNWAERRAKKNREKKTYESSKKNSFTPLPQG